VSGRAGVYDDRQATRTASRLARRLVLPRAAAFRLVATALFLLLFASGAASPLYGVYQAQWRFSATTLTAVFAVYVPALLVALLMFGSLSDYLGRRRVIAAAVAAGAGACGLFLAAHGVGLLLAARALQGAAAGIATSAAGAALIDLQPDRSQRGPVVTSAAVLLGLGAGGLGASVALPVMIAAPALNGFYLSLGPSLAAQVLHSPDLVWGGLVIFLVAGTGAAASVAFRAAAGPTAMLAGCLALLGGVVMTLAAIETASAAAFLAGTAVAGAGVGTGFFAGAYRVLTPLAGPAQRAGRPAPDRRRLLCGARRPRRGGRGQPDHPQALPPRLAKRSTGSLAGIEAGLREGTRLPCPCRRGMASFRA
jgi:MFS family permease